MNCPSTIDNNLYIKIQKNLLNLTRRGYRISVKDHDVFESNVIDLTSWKGPFTLKKELNPMDLFLYENKFGNFRINLSKEPYKSMYKSKFESCNIEN